ncbi:MAG TPA: hypothetical protein VLD62_05980 [Acidimicrobiia bacterium]|nr:hypothetical protein [Acidimicrobiia bacterium]
MRRVIAVSMVVLLAACGLEYEDAGTTTTTTTLAPPTAIPTGPADIVFSDQQVEGTVVTVDSVSMPAPGFVVLQLDFDGVPGDVIGIGDVLVRGVVGNVEVPLFVPLTEAITVHARLHVDIDEDGVFTYEPPDDLIDVPATRANGEDATTTARVELLPPLGPALVVFDDQRSDGDSVRVTAATLPAAGFVGIWTSDEGEPGVLVGRSGLLQAGTTEDLVVELSPPALETAPLIAAVHIDRDENGILVPGDDFDPIGETVDGLPAFTTGFVTVVRLAPATLALEDQESEDGTTVSVSSVSLPGPGFVEISIDGEVLGISELLEPGEHAPIVFEFAALEPGGYTVSVRVVVDFDGDGVLTDLDPTALGGDGSPASDILRFTVPEPPDEDTDA